MHLLFVDDQSDNSEEEDQDLLAGRYRLGSQLGEGGFGVVYAAEQLEPLRRNVAVKVIKPGMDSKEVVARFDAERQALAHLDHPGIAQIYDAGETSEDRPYFVMELVEGKSITEYCSHHQLDIPARLTLFAEVCSAVQHAHQRGIIHRDLKPSNVLVAEDDHGPRLKVIDFGIAKATSRVLTEQTVLTELHQFVGTPGYVSPEQAQTNGYEVDTRTDIYSLGALLYELLTGSPPFEAEELRRAGLGEVLRIIREDSPPKPSVRATTIAKRFPNSETRPISFTRIARDLDWVVMCALEKNPDRRYPTASEFAKDVERILNDIPVEARPPGKLYLAAKFVRRHRAGVAAACIAAIGLLVGLALATNGLVRAKQEAEEARLQAARANAVVRLIDEMFSSADPALMRGADYTVRQLLDDYSQEFQGKLDDQPEVELSLERTIGSAYMGLGDYSSAARHHERALQLSSSLYGPHSEAAITARRNLGWALRHQGRYQQARDELDRCLRSETVADLDRTETKTMLVEVHRLLGDHERSIALARDVRSAASGSLRRLTILALAYADADDFEFARLLGKQALKTAREEHGDTHPHIIRAYDTLAVIAGKEDQAKEALEFAKLGEEIAAKTLPEKHPARLFANARVSELTLEVTPDESTAEFQSLSAKLLEEVGESPEVFRSAVLAAAGMFLQGKTEEAKRFLAETIGVDYTAMIAGGAITSDSAGPAVQKIIAEGRVNDYIPTMEKAHRLAIGLFGREGNHTIDVKRVLFYMYRWAGRYEEAQKMGHVALTHCRKHYGEDSPATFNCLLHLAEVYWDLGREDLVHELFFGDFDGARKPLELAKLQELAARYFYRHGRFREAEQLVTTALSHRRSLHEREHPATLRTLSLLGDIELATSWLRVRAHGDQIRESLTLAKSLHGYASPEVRRSLLQLCLNHSYLLGLPVAIETLEQAIVDARSAGAKEEDLASLQSRLDSCRSLFRREKNWEREQIRKYQALKKTDSAQGNDGYSFLIRAAFRNGLIADHQLAAQQMAEAEAMLQSEVRISQANRAWGTGVKGWLAWRAGNPEAGKEILEKVISETLQGPDQLLGMRAEMLSFLLRIYWDENNEAGYWAFMDSLEDRLAKLTWDPNRREVLLERGARWSFLYQTKPPQDGWREIDFTSELLWNRSLTPLSTTPEIPCSTYIWHTGKVVPITIHARATFAVDAPEDFERLKLRLSSWGGGAIFLNGKEVARRHLDSKATHDQPAVGPPKLRRMRAVPIEIDLKQLRPGKNVLAVELHRTREQRNSYFNVQLEGLRKSQ